MNTKSNFKSPAKVQGRTTRLLFSRSLMSSLLKSHGVSVSKDQEQRITSLYEAGIDHGLSKAVMNSIMNDSERPLFQVNGLWKLLKNKLGVDLAIPMVTGNYVYGGVVSNTITNVGKKIIADQTGGTTTTPVTAIAIGTGSPTATALGAEISSGGGSRGAATVSNTTTTTTGDTERWSRTFNFTGSFSVTEEGLFDNNTSGGKMLASQSFSAVGVGNGDSLQITHDVIIS